MTQLFRKSLYMFITGAILSVTPTWSRGHAADDEISYESKTTEALGATLFAYALDAHVNVGLIADSYQGEVIDDERANSLLDLSVGLLDQIGPYVVKLTEYPECEEGDKKVMGKLVKCFKAIKGEAQALKTYIESGEDEDMENYSQKRKAADDIIDKLLKSTKS